MANKSQGQQIYIGKEIWFYYNFVSDSMISIKLVLCPIVLLTQDEVQFKFRITSEVTFSFKSKTRVFSILTKLKN